MSIKGLATILAALALLAASRPALAACQVAPIVELPITMQGHKALLNVQINGQPVRMFADSGAFFSTLTPATAAELKLPLDSLPWTMRITGVGGVENAALTTVRTFTLAGVPLHNVQFIVSPGGPRDVAGALGQNVLGLDDVEYDLAGGVIRLMHTQGCNGSTDLAYWAQDKPASAIGIESPDQHNPHTLGAAFVNGHRIEVTFDTGADASVLTRAAAERAGIDMNGPDVQSAGLSYGGGTVPVRTWVAKVASFKIGDEEIRNTKLMISDGDLGNSDMLLGADFFLAHRVYVSNRLRKLYFTYNGGPVFAFAGRTMAQDTPDQAPHPSALPSDLGPEPVDAEGFDRRGAALLARGDTARAVSDFDHAVALAPAEPRYRLQRALAQLAARQADLAAVDLDKALALKPDFVDALLTRAQLRISRHDRTGAQADLDAAVLAAPKPADARLALGEFYGDLGQWPAAITQYDLWIDAHDGDSRMFQALGGRCRGRALTGADLDHAVHDCDRALRDRPGGAGLLEARGLAYLRLGRLDRAQADFNAALAIKSDLAWALYGRSLIETKQGQAAQGQADLAAATALRPHLPETAKGFGITAP